MTEVRHVRLASLLAEVDDRGHPDLEVLSVYRDLGVVPKASRDDNFNKTPEDLSSYKRVRPGDVVINKMKAWSGSMALSDHEGIVSGDYMVCAVVGPVHPRYLHHLLRSKPVYSAIAARSTGIRPNQWRLYWEDLRDIRVWLPDPAEQRAIADYLDVETARTDEIVAARRRQSDLLRQSFDAYRSETILRGLDPVSGLGPIPQGWSRPLLGVLIELHRGIDLPTDDREDGDIPVVSSGGISGSHSVAACEGPGVVTGRYGTIGQVFYVEEPYWPLNTTLYVSDFRGNHPRWVFHLLSALPLTIDAEKSAVTGINRNVVGQLRAVRPPVTEQKDIATALDEKARGSAGLVRALEQQIGLLQERRQALITAAVTGQRGISGVVS